jgi:hypothetical protein
VPDADYRIGFLVHRSIVTHAFFLPLLVFALVGRQSRSARFFSVGFSTSIMVHLCFDLFPRSWTGFALIAIPWYGRMGGVFSWLLKSLTGLDAVLPFGQLMAAYELHGQVGQLEGRVKGTVDLCRRLMAKSLETDAAFEQLDAHLRTLVPAEQVTEVENQVAGRKPGLRSRLGPLSGGERGKELERRRLLVDGLLLRAGAAEALPAAELPHGLVAPRKANFGLKPERRFPLPQGLVGKILAGLGVLVVLFFLCIFVSVAFPPRSPAASDCHPQASHRHTEANKYASAAVVACARQCEHYLHSLRWQCSYS